MPSRQRRYSDKIGYHLGFEEIVVQQVKAEWGLEGCYHNEVSDTSIKDRGLQAQ